MPDVATTDRGALGVPIGATFEVAVPARELPMLFCATTLTVYAVPLTSPVTVHDGADGFPFDGVQAHWAPPGATVTT